MAFKHILFMGLDEIAFPVLKNAINTWRAADPKPDLDDEDVYESVKWWVLKGFLRVANNDYYEKVAKTPTIATKVWHLFAIYIPDTWPNQAVIDWVTDLKAQYPNRVEVVRAYNYTTGLYSGKSYDENGDVQGSPVYTPHARSLDFVADIDTDGDGVGDTPPTEFMPMLKVYGQAAFVE